MKTLKYEDVIGNYLHTASRLARLNSLQEAIAYRRGKPISASADKSGIISYCAMNNLNIKG